MWKQEAATSNTRSCQLPLYLGNIVVDEKKCLDFRSLETWGKQWTTWEDMKS